ncbi:MAG: class I SAM-dependent methyltransferase [Desulfobacterales bacterium]|nr:class I SAM-dependent methyltransferase [Desulfobacterales bacterium]
MKDSNTPALAPFGQALLAYWRGKKSAELIHEFKNGQTRSLPVSVFFRSHEEYLTTDNAIEYCRGKILVVGAGTGVHALALEKQGYNVTAIDICPQAVQIMTERGIKDARQENFLHFDSGRFDTIFMLGHNIGICETLKGIKGLLHRCERLIRPGGQLLVNSVKEPEVADPPNQKGYPGELEFRLWYEKNVGP